MKFYYLPRKSKICWQWWFGAEIITSTFVYLVNRLCRVQNKVAAAVELTGASKDSVVSLAISPLWLCTAPLEDLKYLPDSSWIRYAKNVFKGFWSDEIPMPQNPLYRQLRIHQKTKSTEQKKERRVWVKGEKHSCTTEKQKFSPMHFNSNVLTFDNVKIN